MTVHKLPLKQKAIIGLEDGSLGISHDVDLPRLEDDMILIKTKAVALNPSDTKFVGKLGIPGAVAGMDFAGEVVAIGSKCQTATHINIGDRICGAVLGMDPLRPRVGAFADFVGAADIAAMKIPDYMTYEQAATLGSGMSTIGLALFKSLQVPGTPKNPAKKSVDVLVYGGSSSTGALAIQLLKLSGLNPITTCSPHNFELVKSLGATAVFDYKLPTCAEDIRKHTRRSLKFALDCISEPETMQFCYKCLGRTGGKYTALEPYPEFLHDRPRTIVPDWVLGPTVWGKEIGWPVPFAREASEENRNFGIEWFQTVQWLLDEGKLKTHPIQLGSGGLDGALEGLELLRRKQISRCKLIYSLS